MEQTGVHVAPPVNEDGRLNPNHLIIWLDEHIGQSDEYLLLKQSFFTKADPNNGLYEMNLDRHDIDRSILTKEAVPIQLDGVQFILRAFNSIQTCFQAIESNLDKRIFFITSDSKGRVIVPGLMAYLSEKFVPEYYIYVFCAKMNMISTEGAGDPTNSWASDYLENVLMFNHEDDLLARLIVEIANYFFTEAQHLDEDQKLDSACQHYDWSKRMWKRYETMEKKKKTDKIKEIDRLISDVKQRRDQQRDDENDRVAEPCS